MPYEHQEGSGNVQRAGNRIHKDQIELGIDEHDRRLAVWAWYVPRVGLSNEKSKVNFPGLQQRESGDHGSEKLAELDVSFPDILPYSK